MGPATGGTSNNEQVVTMGRNGKGLSVGFCVDVLLSGWNIMLLFTSMASVRE